MGGVGGVITRTFPKVHAKGGNTAPSCKAGVAAILSTTAFTEEGWSWKENKKGWRGRDARDLVSGIP